ncbi:MAG: hemerythrin domain-containing protein [Deltaproteobacteria bacterium]|nr:hemerythrin domain-containing protein [Deltaproteobacteria bacterium]
MDTDIFARIRDDHDKHRTLVELVEKTKGDSRGRRELFAKLATDVRAHADAEERVFYAELMKHTEGREKAGHSVKEHHEADAIIEELLEMDYASTGWLNRFATLAEELRHHMDEEEKEIFPLAGRLLSAERKKAMVAEFDEAKEHEMKKRAA